MKLNRTFINLLVILTLVYFFLYVIYENAHGSCARLLDGHSRIPLVKKCGGKITKTIFTEDGSMDLSEGGFVSHPGSLQKVRKSSQARNDDTSVRWRKPDNFGLLSLAHYTFKERIV